MRLAICSSSSWHLVWRFGKTIVKGSWSAGGGSRFAFHTDPSLISKAAVLLMNRSTTGGSSPACKRTSNGTAKGNGIQVFRPNKHPDSAPDTGCLNEPITAQRANAIPDKGESDGYSQSKGPVQLCMRPLFVFVCCSRFTTI